MRIQREHQTLVLLVNSLENGLLRGILQSLIAAYRARPGEVDPKTASVWYSTRGCQSAKMTAEETAEWLNALHEFKGANLRHLERWAQELSTATGPGHRLRIPCADAPAFITAINDYRLMTAARHDIGQAEMDFDSLQGFDALPPERQQALIEIDLLAWIIEMMLLGLSQQAGNAAPPPPS